MEDKLIARINELAKKSREYPLSDDELAEQKTLREQYISGFRNSMISTLESISIVDKNGKAVKVKPKK